jgi:hypothetical protein
MQEELKKPTYPLTLTLGWYGDALSGYKTDEQTVSILGFESWDKPTLVAWSEFLKRNYGCDYVVPEEYRPSGTDEDGRK